MPNPSGRAVDMPRSALPAAVVLNLQYTGLGIARSLKGQEIPVIGLMSSPRQCGEFSRFCSARSSPSSRTNPQELLAYLLDLGAQVGKGAVLLPTSDSDVLFIAKHREALGTYYAVPLPGADVVDTVMDKAKLCRKAQECGVPVPKTSLCQDLEAVRAAGRNVVYPCVVKPAYSYIWHQSNNWSIVGGCKAIKVWSPRELEESYLRVSRADKTVLVQEFVAGADNQIFVAGVYICQNGDLAVGFTARKLLQYPQETGTGVVVESIRNPEVLSLATRLLQHLGYRGIAEVEFKRDPANGIYHLIEINPRFWDQHRLGAVCGVNLSYMAYRDLTGHGLSPVCGQEEGIYWVSARGLFRCLAGALFKRRTTSGLSVLWRLALGGKEWAVFSWDDPRPALSGC